MKKQILSLCMILALCLGLLPATALAAAPEGQIIYVGNEDVTNGGYWTTSTDGKLTSSSESSWNVHYDVSNNTLTLNGATIAGASSENTNYSTAGIYASSSGAVSLNIELQGENTITSGGYGILVYSPDQGGAATLNITGENDGSLNASGSGNSGIQVQSNSGNATLSIENAKVTATSSYNAGVVIQSSDGSDVSLTVDGGNLTATGSGVRGGIEFQFGTGESGSSTPSLNVSDSTIVKASGGTGGITSNSSPVTPSGTGIVFDNGTGTVYGDVELQKDLEIGEDESMDIPSGASLTIPSGTTLTNEGTVTNNGTLTNHGTIHNSGTLPDNIRGTAPPSITTTSLDGGTVGTAYRATLNTDGRPASWKVTDGSLPPGLTLDESTGVISGTPTAQSTSNFTVTAANNGGSDREQLSITINQAANVPVESVSLSQTELRLIEGDTGALTATVEPDNATNQNVTWSSDNPSAATVNNGVVTAVAAGTATITVTTEDGDKTATCAVTVVHGSLTHTPGNAATCTTEGNEEYWTCETCGKHFSDAGGNTEITLAQTVIPATGHSYENGRCRVCNAPEPGFNPAIIDGAGGTWQKGTEDGLSFTSNAAFTDFVKVQVDGRDLAASDYEVREGSTVVTLKASYLETLSVGKHTLVIVSNTGTATTEFTIQAASAADGDTPSPQTSDNNHVALWIVLLLISVASLSATASYRRKRHASH